MKLTIIMKNIKLLGFIFLVALISGFKRDSLTVEPLRFKEVVINSKALDDLIKKGVSQIIFQHMNLKIDQEGSNHRRHKFQLKAYYLEGENYVKVPADFFLRPNPRRFKPILDATQDGANGNFGNLRLNVADLIPGVDITVYKYLVLIPEVYSGDADYVQYRMYYAETPTDAITAKNAEIKRIIPVPKPMDPSPPAK